jgi:hypothetical protein
VFRIGLRPGRRSIAGVFGTLCLRLRHVRLGLKAQYFGGSVVFVGINPYHETEATPVATDAIGGMNINIGFVKILEDICQRAYFIIALDQKRLFGPHKLHAEFARRSLKLVMILGKEIQLHLPGTAGEGREREKIYLASSQPSQQTIPLSRLIVYAGIKVLDSFYGFWHLNLPSSMRRCFGPYHRVNQDSVGKNSLTSFRLAGSRYVNSSLFLRRSWHPTHAVRPAFGTGAFGDILHIEHAFIFMPAH